MSALAVVVVPENVLIIIIRVIPIIPFRTRTTCPHPTLRCALGINDAGALRLAVDNMQYLTSVLGIKDHIHKQKIALKAMDVVLFGPPRGECNCQEVRIMDVNRLVCP